MIIHVDIETLPAIWMSPEQKLRYAYKRIPKGLDHEAQAAWLLEHGETEWRKTALYPQWGEIWLIGVAVNDEEPTVHRKIDGLIVLADLIERSLKSADTMPPLWVGKSHRAFDLPWLAQHALLEGVHGLQRHLVDALGKEAHRYRIDDVAELWPSGVDHIRGHRLAPSLDPMATWMGLAGKTDGMDGSKVYDAYLADEEDLVAKYCAQDIVSTRECWKVLRGLTPARGGRRPAPKLPDIPADVLAAVRPAPATATLPVEPSE